MTDAEKLIKQFPMAQPVGLQGGINLYFEKFTVSIWFKKRKYGIGTNWSRYSDIDDLIKVLTYKLLPKAPRTTTEVKEDIGTKACIEHIARKIEKIQLSNRPADAVTVLLSLAVELEQYL